MRRGRGGFARARAPRRKTFWLGVESVITVDPNGGSPSGSSTDDLAYGSGDAPYDNDPTPTLVALRGNLVVIAGRDGPTTANATQQCLYSWGLSVQERVSGQDVLALDTAADLGDERIIYQRHGVVSATTVTRPYWDGAVVQFLTRIEHTGDYPQVFDINIRAQRKFEETTKIVAHATYFTDLDEFDFVTFRFLGRALFKAS